MSTGAADDDLRVLHTLDELVDLVRDRQDLYVRWSQGPHRDRRGSSLDELSGVPLPGLSASALGVEPWWGDRDRTIWVARRTYDYAHLPVRRRGRIRPWVLEGRLCGRGPDNEPLVENVRPVAWLGESLIKDAHAVVVGLNNCWGSLDRPTSERTGSRQRNRMLLCARTSAATDEQEIAGYLAPVQCSPRLCRRSRRINRWRLRERPPASTH